MKKKSFSDRAKAAFKEFRRDMTKKLVALFFFVLAGLAFWVLMQMLYYFYGFSLVDWIKGTQYIYPAFKHVFDAIAARSFEGIIYLFMFSSLFFLPVPLEVMFTTLLYSGLDSNMLTGIVRTTI